MNRSIWLFLFFADLILELAAIYFEWPRIAFIAKPLLMTFLGAYFIQQARTHGSIRFLILIALFFSWLGDVFLLLEEENSSFFIAGLVCFLIAHVFYILFFLRVRSKETTPGPWNWWKIGIVGVYVLALFIFLNPALGEMRLPVLAYALVLGSMVVCCWHAFTPGTDYFWYCLIGAILFVLSDSMLAINKFRQPFAGADVWTMLTYALAQFCIVYGSLKWMTLQRQHSHQKLVM